MVAAARCWADVFVSSFPLALALAEAALLFREDGIDGGRASLMVAAAMTWSIRCWQRWTIQAVAGSQYDGCSADIIGVDVGDRRFYSGGTTWGYGTYCE